MSGKYCPGGVNFVIKGGQGKRSTGRSREVAEENKVIAINQPEHKG
jgi:hypothetical protein